MNQTTVNVETGYDLILTKASTIKSIRRYVNNMESGGHFFCFGDRSTQSQQSDIIRWAAEIRNVVDKNVGNIFLNSVARAEMLQPGSGRVCAIAAIEFLDNFTKSGDVTINKDDLNKSLNHMLKRSFRPSGDDIKKVLKKVSADRLSWDLFQKSIELAGPAGTIQVFESQSDDTMIKKCSGYRFGINMPEIFISSSNIRGKVSLLGPKLVAIDGVIESMSEINGLIHSSYKESTPLVIVARGFADDVSNTLGANYSTGNLNIIPCIVPYDILGANLLKDMCSVSGGDVISSLKGEIISAIAWDDIRNVKKVEIADCHTIMTMINPEARHRVARLRKEISKKKQGITDENIPKDHLDKRLASLGGQAVQVYLGRNLGDLIGITKDRIDHYVRYYRSACSKGLVPLDADPRIPAIVNVVNRLKKSGNVISVTSLVLGIQTGLSCAKSIHSVAASITMDQ